MQKATLPKVSPRDIIAPVHVPRVEENYCYGEGVQLVDLKERMCHWPLGDPKEPGFKFCGGPSVEGMPYCDHHCRVAYQVNTKSKLRIDELSKIDLDVIRKKRTRRNLFSIMFFKDPRHARVFAGIIRGE